MNGFAEVLEATDGQAAFLATVIFTLVTSMMFFLGVLLRDEKRRQMGQRSLDPPPRNTMGHRPCPSKGPKNPPRGSAAFPPVSPRVINCPHCSLNVVVPHECRSADCKKCGATTVGTKCAYCGTPRPLKPTFPKSRKEHSMPYWGLTYPTDKPIPPKGKRIFEG